MTTAAQRQREREQTAGARRRQRAESAGGDDEPFGDPATIARYEREAKRASRARDRDAGQLYDEGRKAGRAAAKKRKAAGAKVKSGARRGYRTVARELRNPVTSDLTSGTQVLVLTLAVIALYLVLEHAGPLEGFVGGIARGVEWLQRPDRSIPYKAH